MELRCSSTEGDCPVGQLLTDIVARWRPNKKKLQLMHTCSSCATSATTTSSSTSSSTRGHIGKLANTGCDHIFNALALKLTQQLVYSLGVGLDGDYSIDQVRSVEFAAVQEVRMVLAYKVYLSPE